MEIILSHVGEHPLQGHPMVPLLQVASDPGMMARYGGDIDLGVDCGGAVDEDEGAYQLLALVMEAASRRHMPRVVELRNTDFQLTRGLLGVSL